MYMAWARLDLRQSNVVGVGPVCRRQGTKTAADLFSRLRSMGLRRLHAFGSKTAGLPLAAEVEEVTPSIYDPIYERAAERGFPLEILEQWLKHAVDGGPTTWEAQATQICKFLASSDSTAWSTRAREHAKDAARKAGRLDEYIRSWSPAKARKEGLRTQMLKACFEAYKQRTGRIGGHAHCGNCLDWALKWRRELLAKLPAQCRKTKPDKRQLPAPPACAEAIEAEVAHVRGVMGRLGLGGEVATEQLRLAWARE
jgi:hypothetical protein